MIQFHRENQALGGHLQKLAIKITDVNGRQFHQCRDFIEQRLIVVVLAQRGLLFLGALAQHAVDFRATLVETGNDTAFLFETRFVFVGVRKFDVCSALKPVAVSDATGFEAQCVNGNNVGTMQRNQAVGGAHELHGGFAIGQLIAHDFWYRQSRDGFVQCRLQSNLQ